MTTKTEIIAELEEKGIAHDPEASKEDLEALLPGDESSTETIGDVEVGDPQILRPVELPLVVKPAKGGEWANEAQAKYAAGLNAYAYKNPAKWAAKKNDRTVNGKVILGLISKLIEIGKDPSALQKYTGNSDSAGSVKYSDKRIAQ